MAQQPLFWLSIKKFQKHVFAKTYAPLSFIAALFTVARTQTQPKCPSAEDCIKNTWHACMKGYYSAIRKGEVLPFVRTWMDLKNIMLSEIHQSEKSKNHMISLICGM